MTDLEITKLCFHALSDNHTFEGVEGIVEYKLNGISFDPLHDDAQAMALVKRLNLNLGAPTYPGTEWSRWYVHRKGHPDVAHVDLNRAICECVARMQKAKCTP